MDLCKAVLTKGWDGRDGWDGMTGKETCEKRGLNFLSMRYTTIQYGEMERCDEIGGDAVQTIKNGLKMILGGWRFGGVVSD
jgi:hypothetical protein